MTAKGGVESEAGVSPAKISDIGEGSWKSASACSQIGELVPVSTAQQESEAVLEKMAVPVHPVSPTWKEPVLEDSSSSGEPVGSSSDGCIYWASPRLQAEFGPLDEEVAEWSSHSSPEEEWGNSQENVEVLPKETGVPDSAEGTRGALQIPVCVKRKF